MNFTLRQNTTNMAPSQYQDFFFDRGMISVGGKRIGLNCNALCELTGDKDNAANISAEFQPGAISFSDGEKRVRSLHTKGHFEDKDSLTVKYAMDSLTPDFEAVEAATSRVGAGGGGSLKFNGIRARHGEYLSVLVGNVLGKYFFIDKIVAIMVHGSRK